MCVCNYANIKNYYILHICIHPTDLLLQKIFNIHQKKDSEDYFIIKSLIFFFLQYGNHHENIPRDEPEITGSVANLIDKLILMRNIVNFFPLLIVVTMINQLCGT